MHEVARNFEQIGYIWGKGAGQLATKFSHIAFKPATRGEWKTLGCHWVLLRFVRGVWTGASVKYFQIYCNLKLPLSRTKHTFTCVAAHQCSAHVQVPVLIDLLFCYPSFALTSTPRL
jgi:hypothetical protein